MRRRGKVLVTAVMASVLSLSLSGVSVGAYEAEAAVAQETDLVQEDGITEESTDLVLADLETYDDDVVLTEGGSLHQEVIDGKKYLLYEDGTHYTGWYDMISGSWRLYFNPEDDGAAATGITLIEEKAYLFDGNGLLNMHTGTPIINGAKYWVEPDYSLRKGWLYLGDWKMCFDEVTYACHTGMSEIDGHMYLFTKDGVMQVHAGTPVIEGKKYWFATEGYLRSGWLNLGQWKLYFDPVTYEGYLNGIYVIDGDHYIFDQNGVVNVQCGTPIINGKKYWTGSKGELHSGWLNLGGSLMYFSPDDFAALTGRHVVDGQSYFFNKDGVVSKGYKVAIDAGHQRHGSYAQEPIGPGASTTKARVTSGTSGVASGLDEYELNLIVSLQLRAELESRGYEVYMIRETHDVDISNRERAQNAAAAGSDILVRIHANGSDNHSVQGALTMAPSSGNPYCQSIVGESQRLSRLVLNSYIAATGANSQGVYITDEMSGINWSTIPVTIVEMGYMSNPDEDLRMASASYQVQMVQGIANGIDTYFN